MIIIYSALGFLFGFFVLRLVLRFPEKKFVFSGNLKLQSSERSCSLSEKWNYLFTKTILPGYNHGTPTVLFFFCFLSVRRFFRPGHNKRKYLVLWVQWRNIGMLIFQCCFNSFRFLCNYLCTALLMSHHGISVGLMSGFWLCHCNTLIFF